MSDFFNEWFYGSDDDDDDSSWLDGGGGDDGEPPWYGNEITLWTNEGEPVSNTLDNWREMALLPLDFLEAMYGLHTLDILYQLEDQGFMSDDDWATWRNAYEAIYG